MSTDCSFLASLAKAQPKFLNKGGLCIGLVVTERAQRDGLPLDATTLRTKERGQVQGLGYAAVRSILADFGVTAVLAKEGGRTNRGSLGLMEQYVAALNAAFKEQDSFDLFAVMAWWVGKVKLHLASEGPLFRFDPSKSIAANVTDLFEQVTAIQENSGGTQYVGAMLQHLVGAKLDIVLGPSVVAHHGASVNDQSTGRQADFEANGAAIHVTTQPSEALIQKAVANLKAGLRPVIVTWGDGVRGAEYLLSATDGRGRVDVVDAIQFLTVNIYERSLFRVGDYKATLSAILHRYNEIVSMCETDPALKFRLQP